MQFDLRNLEKKREELQEKISRFEAQKASVKSTLEKLTARYNIGEIKFDEYRNEYQRLFGEKTPEQWTNYYNIQIKSCKAQLDWYDSEIKKTKKRFSEKELASRDKEERRRAIEEKIRTAESYKMQVIGSVREVVKKYNSKEISREQYEKEISEMYGGKEPQKLIEYYDNYVKKARDSLENESGSLHASSLKKFLPFVLIFGLVLATIFGLVIRTQFTGLAVQTIEEKQVERVNEIFNGSGIYEFESEGKKINWMKFSGSLKEGNTAKIYLDGVLVFDSEGLNEKNIGAGLLTGFATEGSEDSSDASEDSGSSEESSEGPDVESTSSESTADTNDDSEESGMEENNENSETEENEDTNDSEIKESDDSGSTNEEAPIGGEQNESNEPEGNETQAEVDVNQTSESGGDVGVVEEIREIKFEDYCRESCNLSSNNFGSGAHRLEIDGEIVLEEFSYGIDVESEGAEQNVSAPPNLIKEIPDVLVEKNGYYDLELEDYFEGATDYYMKQTDNITTALSGTTLRIQPEENFTGKRESRIVAVNEFGNYGSNLFNIHVIESNLTSTTINESENVTLNVTTKRYNVIINKPVRWVTKVEFENESAVADLLIEIPKASVNISIKTGDEASELFGEEEREDEGMGITGNVVGEIGGESGLVIRLIEWIKRFSITGRAIDEEEDEIVEGNDKKMVDIGKIVERTEENEIAIEYYTDAPTTTEEIRENGKRIVVSAADELNYTDVLAYSILDDSLLLGERDSIQVYWRASYEDAVAYGWINTTSIGRIETMNGTEEIQQKEENASLDELAADLEKKKNETYAISIPFEVADLDSDGRIDYLEWIVPHLSNQTFDIIINGTTSILGSNLVITNERIRFSIGNSDPYDQLVLYLPFDADNISNQATSTLYDYASYSYNGYASQATINYTGCSYGKCMHFDGNNDWINFTGNSINPLNFSTGGFSVLFWMNANQFSGYLMDNGVAGTNEKGFNIQLSGGAISAKIKNGTTQNTISKDVSGREGEWIHVAYVIDRTAGRHYLYIDGAVVANSTALDGTYTPYRVLEIGRDNTATQGYFNGSLDEIMFFNKTLTGSQIGAIYSNTSIRYASESKIDVAQFNITTGQNIVDLSVSEFVEDVAGASINLSLGYWNKTYGYNVSDFASPNQLIGYYHFDEGSWSGSAGEVIDSSSYSNDGTASLAQTTSNGRFDRGAQFNGPNRYIDLESWINHTGNFSISAWFYNAGVTPGYGGCIICSDYMLTTSPGSESGWGLYNGADGKIHFKQYGKTLANYEVNSSYTNRTWMHVVGVINGTEMVLYVNGIKSANSSFSPSDMSYAAYKPRIGSDPRNLYQDFNGTIDELMIFNRSVSASEAFELYAKGRANWSYTSYSPVVGIGQPPSSSHQFTIPDSTSNLHVRAKLETGVAQFYSPVLYAPTSAPAELITSGISVPVISFIGASPQNNGYISSSNYVLNISTSDDSTHYTFVDTLGDVLLWVRMDDLDGSGNPIDLSSYSRSLTSIGSVIYNDTNSIFGDKANFDGSTGRINVTTLIQGINTTEGTMSLWMKMDSSIISDSVAHGVFEIGSISDAANTLGIRKANTNTLLFRYRAGSANYDATISSLTNFNSWQHVVAVWNSTTVSIYQNGSLINNVTKGGEINKATANLNQAYIGTEGQTVLTQHFKGDIDEAIVFNRQLSGAEIKALYNATVNQYYRAATMKGTQVNLTAHAVNSYGFKSESNLSFSFDNSNPSVFFVEPNMEEGSWTNESSVSTSLNASDSTQVYAMIDFGRDILSWLPMQNITNGNVTDLSTYGNNGSVIGGVSSLIGMFGNGLSFSGSDPSRVSIWRLNNGQMYNSNAFSVSIWFKVSESGTQGIVSDYVEDSSSFPSVYRGWSLRTQSDILNFYTGSSAVSGTTNVSDGNWHHVVASVNSTSVSIYLDNNLEVSGTRGTITANSDRKFLLGAEVESDFGTVSYVRLFNGLLDDFVLYNKTLASSEVRAIYDATNNVFLGNVTGLVSGNSYQGIGYASDSAGNVNTTERFTVKTDSVAPFLNFTGQTPANGSSISAANATINATVSDSLSNTYSFLDVAGSTLLWYDMEVLNSSGDPQDISGRGRNGITVGGATQSASGIFGESFRGTNISQYVKAPTINNLNLSNTGFTQSMWFRLESLPTAGQTNYLSYFYAGTRDAHFFRAEENAGTYSLQAYGEMDNDDYIISKSGMTPAELLNKWHHLASVYNKTDVIFYVDGVRIGSDKTSEKQDSLDFSLNFFGYDMAGKVDEVLIFNRTLKESEVFALYNSTANPLYANLSDFDFGNGLQRVVGHVVDKAGNKNSSTLEFTISGATPAVSYVEPIGTVIPVENGVANIEFSVGVSDADGIADIGSVSANFTRTGESVRQNGSCVAITGEATATLQNYSCTISMWYFDEAGPWNIGVYANDSAGVSGINTTETFVYDSLVAMQFSPSTLDFGTLATGQENVTGPFTRINNTGNYPSNISVTGYDLIGQSDSSTIFSVKNVSVSGNTGEPYDWCTNGINLQNGVALNVTGVYLTRGNHSVNDGNTGQEILYYCISRVPYLPSQQYTLYNPDTQQTNSWIIRIALAVFVAGRRKKTRKEILQTLKRRLHKSSSIEELALLDEKLKKDEGMTLSELLDEIRREKEQLQIPVEVFKQEIGPSEALCKYMKENLGFSYSEIAVALNRDDRTVWINYRNASIKKSGRTKVKPDSAHVPVSIFRDRRLSVLESVVIYFRERGMSNVELAQTLGRDPRNVWTLYSRAVKKLGK